MKVIRKIKRKSVAKLLHLFGFLQEKYQQQQIDLKKSTFKDIGSNVTLPFNSIIKNPQYISIGEDFYALDNLRLEAWDTYGDDSFSPQLVIGNNVVLNTDVHIGCVNKIVIGNNVMMASRIFIADCSHGEITKVALSLIPTKRPLISKGPVIIEDNVWIGEGVCILDGVTVGRNSIIGANSVVTTNIPPNSVVAGVPGRVLRVLD